MTTYKCKTTFDTLHFEGGFAEASSPIYAEAESGHWVCTPFQVADAGHDPKEAALMIIKWFGPDYWLNPEAEEGEDENGELTYDGMTEEEYIEDLILDVEEIEDADADADD
jgi:hypothetical protein